MAPTYIRWFEELTLADIPIVGGKNASLGELVQLFGRRSRLLLFPPPSSNILPVPIRS